MVSLRLAPDPTRRLLGHTLGEAPGHIWMQWLLDQAAGGAHAWFGQEGVILGERLWVVPTDWASRLVSGALGVLVGPIAAYNLTALGLLALAGAAAARLARLAGAGRWPSALAALITMWHPALLGFLADGRIDSMGAGWVGMLAAAWLVAMRAPSWSAGLAVGGWAVGVVLSGPNLTVATAMAAAAPSVAAAALDRRRLRPLASAAAVAAVAAVAVVALIFSVERHDSARLEQQSNVERRPVIEALDAEAVAARRQADFWGGASVLNRTVPVGSAWALPTEIHDSPATRNAATMTTTQPFAPGAWWVFSAVPWLLAGLGLLRSPRQAAPWVAMAAAMKLLGLGHGSSQTLPLALGGQLYYIAPAVLIERIPGLSVFNNYGLFSTFETLAVAVAAALGCRALPWRPWWCLGAVALWLLEVQRGPTPLPLAVNDMRLPDGLLEAIEPIGGGEAVFLLPISKDLNNYLQTHHQRPTLMRFRFGAAEPQAEPMLADPNGSANDLLRAARGEHAAPDLAARLADGGVGAVVVMPSLLPPAEGAQLQQRVQQALGTPSWSDGARQVYRLAP